MVEALFVICILAIVGVLGWAVYDTGSQHGYTDGYCAAIHGTVLTATQCNVNDRVIEIAK
jgi:predicted negative regulator of RcsB-dependent stress response